MLIDEPVRLASVLKSLKPVRSISFSFFLVFLSQIYHFLGILVFGFIIDMIFGFMRGEFENNLIGSIEICKMLM